MTLLNFHHVHDFFQNKEMNLFYLAIGIMNFAQSLISLFVPIYLFNLGYSIPQIIFYFILTSFVSVVLSYPGAKVVSKIGIKHSILLSVPFLIIYYLGLRSIGTYPILFILLPIIISFRTPLYNFSYHLNFMAHSNRRKRGRQISFIMGIVLLIQVLAPLFGGLIATYYGFSVLYILGSVLLLFGTIPLFLTKENYKKINFTFKGLWKEIFSKRERGVLISFTSYAIESWIGRIIWPIFLITILVTVSKTGFIYSISILISLIVLFFIGRFTDKHKKEKLLKIGTLLFSLAWFLRIFAITPIKIFFIDSFRNIAQRFIRVPWEVKTYEIASRRGMFKFIVAREVIFNSVRVILMPLVILVFYINYHPFMISFLIASVFSLGYFFLEK